ncbi:alpha-glucosidase family protein [Crocosphaera chwakensis]|uniref:Oligo-1,6-glucosidase n=1 Tax=Crocosphaera chwakensis CCY0110 TaxID=391612 RepID=A3IRF0_9CHRO|nr:alpha-glucosidase family protein [Crocosphaera chwakensis]EAZ90952.1 oligo-1,6-glucosidase [Crocosphaera chwakensis CCY0110]
MIIQKNTDTKWWKNFIIDGYVQTLEETNNQQSDHHWWQHAIIYQIYVSSFKDTTSNGMGDLDGIIAKMDYIASLGVDAIWLSPFFESPLEDMGYDITDMREVDPTFGEIEDFKRLLEIAHGFGIKVLVDGVWNHTSDQHPWFVESRKNRDNPKADWYVWADAKEDGSPPNNWLSAFMGESAWQWDDVRQQYYFYNFLPSQPELNWHNRDVVAELLRQAEFWLDLGIDGFRLDAVNFYIHDKHLRDNPIRPDNGIFPDGVDPNNPMVDHMFQYNFCRPENLEAINPIRELCEHYGDAVTLGEVTLCEDSIALSGEYVTGENRLNLAYNSALLVDEPISATLMRQILQKVQTHFPDGGQCWMVGNHDYGRLRSRWTGVNAEGQPYPDEFYHAIAALLICLPGALCLYQGDELGLEEAKIPKDIPEDKIQDPFGQALYPTVPGRDGSRTPMPWSENAPNAGFSDGDEPWLPIPQKHLRQAVDRQNADPKSLLNTWRRMLHWRKRQPALVKGDVKLLDTEEPLLVFIRQCKFQQLLCVFNLSHNPTTYDLSMHGNYLAETDLGFEFDLEGDTLKLQSYGIFFANLSL